MWNVGTNFYQWATSSYGGGSISYKSTFFNFNSGNVNPLNSGYRADAFTVRCVQELTPLSVISVFFFFVFVDLWVESTARLIKEEFAVEWLVNSAIH